MATVTKKRRGFPVHCIKCGEPGTVRIELADVENLSCSSCDAEFTTDDVRYFIARWTRALKWIDTAPGVYDGFLEGKGEVPSPIDEGAS